MKKNKTRIVASFLVFTLALFFSGCGCKKDQGPQYKISLEVWGGLDDSYTFSQIFEKYQRMNPHIQRIEYKKVNYDTYKKDVIDALASGQGPDVLLIHNSWLPIFKDKIVPADPTILGEQKFRQDFVDVAAADFLDEGKVWATPLSVDSLGLYYNKDYFNAAGITSPPKNWNEFVEDVKILTKFGVDGEVERSGVAMGTDTKNVNRATDILTLLMLQNGTEMIDQYGRVTIDTSKIVNGESIIPAENALKFYASFANRGSLNYCWNPDMHYSIDAFSEGQAAMMLNYSWQVDTVAKKSPRLNFAVAPVPQFAGSAPINFANYWGFAVSKNKIPSTDPGAQNYSSPDVTNEIRTEEAWRLASFLTTKPALNTETDGSATTTLGRTYDPNYDPAAEYVQLTSKPAARRDLIEKQKTDPKLGVFAAGNLIAKSWRQPNPEAVEVIFDEMIEKVNRGEVTSTEAIRTASQMIMKVSEK